MRRPIAHRHVALLLMAGALTLATPAGAQAPASGGPRIGENSWRLSASAGSYVPRSAIIVGADGKDTRLGSGPSFTIDAEYIWQDNLSIYGSGTLASSAITLGTAIAPSVTGPSDQVLVLAGTGGVLLSTALGTHLRPTLRLGGGIKGYSFDLASTKNQWRPTADIGVGFRGNANGAIGVSAEVRYLPSSFDQGKLPIRGIVPQAQRQTDLLFSVGVSVRP